MLKKSMYIIDRIRLIQTVPWNGCLLFSYPLAFLLNKNSKSDQITYSTPVHNSDILLPVQLPYSYMIITEDDVNPYKVTSVLIKQTPTFPTDKCCPIIDSTFTTTTQP